MIDWVFKMICITRHTYSLMRWYIIDCNVKSLLKPVDITLASRYAVSYFRSTSVNVAAVFMGLNGMGIFYVFINHYDIVWRTLNLYLYHKIIESVKVK